MRPATPCASPAIPIHDPNLRPASASSVAVAAPIPDAPPVTMATFPEKFINLLLFHQ